MTEDSEVFCEPNPCIDYMYKLCQHWPKGEKSCVFIMLNPARVTDLANNKTVSNCRAIAKEEGCKGIILLDLFSYVAEIGSNLKAAKKKNSELDIVGGKEHEKHVKSTLKKRNILVVIAWGDGRPEDFKEVVGFDKQVEHMEKMIRKYVCLKNGDEIMQLERAGVKGVMVHPCNFSRLENVELGKRKKLYRLEPYEFRFEQDGFLCKLLRNLYAPLKRIACKQGNSL